MWPWLVLVLPLVLMGRNWQRVAMIGRSISGIQYFGILLHLLLVTRVQCSVLPSVTMVRHWLLPVSMALFACGILARAKSLAHHLRVIENAYLALLLALMTRC